jgi:hypothetical protein
VSAPGARQRTVRATKDREERRTNARRPSRRKVARQRIDPASLIEVALREVWEGVGEADVGPDVGAPRRRPEAAA